jgi:hypothetical protein
VRNFIGISQLPREICISVGHHIEQLLGGMLRRSVKPSSGSLVQLQKTEGQVFGRSRNLFKNDVLFVN